MAAAAAVGWKVRETNVTARSQRMARWDDGMMEEETCGESSIRDYFFAPWPQLNLAAVAHALPTLYMHLGLDSRETSQTILSYIRITYSRGIVRKKTFRSSFSSLR